ncbi:MAG TPA: IS30 family transposase [Thiohalobacter sp.]|nr:IS30 family transposase [Thiohalobacter sp.]
MPYQHINAAERQVIQRALEAGESRRSIARSLGRNHSSISREIRRNGGRRAYKAAAAQHRAEGRASRPRHTRRFAHKPLKRTVLTWLALDWSPAIISGRLRRDFPKDGNMRVSAESIYHWVYRDALQGGRLYRHLWQRRHRRIAHRSRMPAHSRIPDRIDITERPPAVAERARIGDWEGDTVVGRKNRGGLVTHLERVTRYLVAGRIPNKRAATFATATNKLLGWVPASLCHTLTLDNGTENAAHARIAKAKTMDVYFAHPHAPWQRGANEQVNGLIRRYFPKGTDFRKVTDEQVAQVVMQINQRPRKCLDYQSPYEVFAEALRGALRT